MPTVRHVSLVQKLQWHVSGNISPTAFAIGDVDGHGDNAFVIGNLVGELFIFKGNDPDGQPWLTCRGLGTITAVAIGDIRNWGKNSIVVMSAEGLCHIFDVSGLEDDRAQTAAASIHTHTGTTPATVRTAGVPGKTPSVYSSTPRSSYQQSMTGGHHSHGSNLPATPNIKPVPDIHHHGHYHQSHHGTPPLPPAPQNTPHGSTSSSASAFPHHSHTPNATPVHPSHVGSMTQGGSRRGSDAPSGVAGRTSAVLANLIGTPPPSSIASHGPSSSHHHPRSVGGHSNVNSPTGTPLLKPQQVHSGSNTPAQYSRDNNSKRPNSHSRHPETGRTKVRTVGGRRVLERPNLTLPVPVNINRAHIADIDGDGLNELVLARTDRILHSYSLQATKTPNTGGYPNNQPLSLVKLFSRSSTMSTAESSGLLSPSEDRRETVIHYPSMSSMGRQFYGGAAAGSSESQDGTQTQGGDSSNRLILVEKKRWALDGQINCLSVTKDAQTGLPILLVAQPGLKFVMVDHTGNMSEPVTQIQRAPTTNTKVNGPDTPTRGAGGGDVATDIVCGTQYVNGEKKEIIGLMSMDGAFALHDLHNNTVKVHDLDSTHKIFGFSKLNFGKDYHDRQAREARKSRPGYGRRTSRYVDDMNDGDVELEDDDIEHDGFELGSDGGDTIADNYSERGYPHYDQRSRRPRKQAPSLLIPEPYGARFQRSDMFVGCSWSGITFFIDQEFNTAQYDFDARVCAFGAGQYAVTPGRNEPCLFYVDFEDNIYVYYNLYIQTKPTIQFQDVFNSDAALVRLSQKMHLTEKQSGSTDERPQESATEKASFEDIRDGIKTPHEATPWSGKDMQEFVHESLYNVNRYEDEYQALRRLADIERAKRASIFEAEAAKERQRMEAGRRGLDKATAAAAGSLSSVSMGLGSSSSSSYIDSQLMRRSSYSPSEKTMIDLTNATPDATTQRSPSRAKISQRRQFSAHDIQTEGLGGKNPVSPSKHTQHHQHLQHLHQYTTEESQLLSPSSAASSSTTSSPTSPKPPKGYNPENRRSSLLIKDVLSHYEGHITPPLKSPTSPSAASQQSSRGPKGGSTTASSSSTASLTNIMKRFSLKDMSNGGRLSRNTGGGGAISSSGGVVPGVPLVGGATLGKGKTLDARVGKSLRVNRPVGGARSRQLGVASRKVNTGVKSRLSLQQDCEDESESGNDEMERAASEGTGETDGDNLLDFDRSSRKSGGEEDDLPQEQEDRLELGGGNSELFNRERNGTENEDGEDEITGAYTPSTISPIPSPSRFYNSQQSGGGGQAIAELSPSLEESAFMLAKSLLSPSSRPFTSTITTGAIGKSSRSDQGSGPRSSSSSRGHNRQRSGQGLLDTGLGLLPTREIVATVGLSSGPNSAGQDGRHSRAESVLSTGSDIPGVIVPDITLMASSFPTQSNIPLSTSEPFSQRQIFSDDSDEDDGDADGSTSSKRTDNHAKEGLSGIVRRPPRRSNTLGSQDSNATRGTGSGSDTAAGQSSKRNSRSTNAPSGADVKLMPAPLPRSHQHYQRYQQEHLLMQQHNQQQQQGSLSSSAWLGPLDNDAMGPHGTGSHVSFSSSTRPISGSGSASHAGSGLIDTSQDSMFGGFQLSGHDVGFGRGRTGKSSSTTSSTTASDFGSGPSSPLSSNVNSANAILSNPSSNNFKGFGVLSFPVTSPSGSTAAAHQQQHQYFASSHYHQQTPPLSSVIARGGPPSHESTPLEDDRASVRSKNSSFRGRGMGADSEWDSRQDISSALASAPTFQRRGQENDPGMSSTLASSTSTAQLASDSLVRRLEELQQQDQDLEERQRRKEREHHHQQQHDSRANLGSSSTKASSSRPSILSRANSGASVQSAVSHRTVNSTHAQHPVAQPLSSHGSSGIDSGGPASGSSQSKAAFRESDHHESTKRLKNRPGLGQGL